MNVFEQKLNLKQQQQLRRNDLLCFIETWICEFRPSSMFFIYDIRLLMTSRSYSSYKFVMYETAPIGWVVCTFWLSPCNIDVIVCCFEKTFLLKMCKCLVVYQLKVLVSILCVLTSMWCAQKFCVSVWFGLLLAYMSPVLTLSLSHTHTRTHTHTHAHTHTHTNTHTHKQTNKQTTTTNQLTTKETNYKQIIKQAHKNETIKMNKLVD